jgi:hypothetical protein
MGNVRHLRLAGAALLGVALAGIAALAFADPSADPGRAPDPPAHPSLTQWVFDLRVHDGMATVQRVHSVTLDKPASSARMMGRFALELYIGPELLDRVRFAVPLMADPADPADRRPNRRPTFGDVTTHVSVTMADNPRATYVVVLDRASGAEQRFWWPPEPDGRLVPMRPSSDAGTDGASSASPQPAAPPADAGHD